MPERYITPVADIALLNPEDDEPIIAPNPTGKDGDPETPLVASWSTVMLRLLAHPRLTGSTPVLKSHNLLKRKIKASRVGEAFAVPEEDWKRLADILNDPDHLGGEGQQKQTGVNALSSLTRYAPAVLPQLEEMFTAWTDAPTKPPEKKAEPFTPPAA